MKLANIFERLENRSMIVPLLEDAITSGNWPDSYTVTIDSAPYYGLTDVDGKGGKGGSGDGYFHPSTHPFWGERRLFLAFHPKYKDEAVREARTLTGELTLSVGSALHGIIQAQFEMAGVLRPENVEYEYVNKEHHCRGRIDFILDMPNGTTLPVELKALDVGTPILTEAGWSTMGELADGDKVYAPDGELTTVTKAHPVRVGRPCYEVKFRDGQSIVADEDHLWTVVDTNRSKSHSQGRERVMTTKEIAEAGVRKEHQKYRFKVAVPEPIQRPEADLPIDPWLLGMWLGDGSSAHAEICSGEEDLPFLEERLNHLGVSYRVNRYEGKAPRVYLHDMRGVFVREGLLGNKHIPEKYMLASESQRRELLRGLLDSDGSCSHRQVSIYGVREKLMRQVLQLVRSLGYRAGFGGHRAKIDGVDKGDVYAVRFSSQHGDNPFGLPRKRERFASATPSKQDLRMNSIVSVEPVESRPTRCITVEHESSLYLVGEGFVPTHNTMNSYSFRNLEQIKDSWDAQLSMALDNSGHDMGILLVMEAGWPYTMREFRVPRNDKLLSKTYEKFDRVRDYLEDDVMPPPCCAPESAEMKGCPFRHFCWKGTSE